MADDLESRIRGERIGMVGGCLAAAPFFFQSLYNYSLYYPVYASSLLYSMPFAVPVIAPSILGAVIGGAVYFGLKSLFGGKKKL